MAYRHLTVPPGRRGNTNVTGGSAPLRVIVVTIRWDSLRCRAMASITESRAWRALQADQRDMSKTHMRDLFAQDPERFKRFSVTFKDILLDFSKNRVTDETM